MNMRSIIFTVVAGASIPLFADVAMPRIMSHRGESNDRPENTMAAFRLAFERGVDGVECDVYATTDNVPVIIHDSTTGRTAGSGTNLTVTASSWNDLKDVRVGAFGSWIGTEWEGEKLPKLEDYLALLSMNSTTRCIIELKGNGANNLVSNVVEVVKAQPLATSDRVVFIAFDSSLISAVRTALPTYEAWLLLKNGTYTGDGLKTQVQNCNATGVDIHYQSTFSAGDVAAVKAAGYAFAVWTCDNDNTALALAQKGVEEIATNRGGAMKTALAALIAEADSHAEINEPNFPAGATLMEPSAYVQTGLVGHFDGIRNAGANLPHDPATRTWKNLVSGRPDAKFYCNGPESSDGYWNAAHNGFFFDGKETAALVSGIDMGMTFTFQLVTDIDLTKQHTQNTTGSCAYKGQYPTYFTPNTVDDGFFSNNKGSTASKELIFKHNDSAGWMNANARPSITTWGGKYATGIVGGGTAYLIQGTELVGGQTYTEKKNIGACPYAWAGKTSGTDRFIYGTYHAVRMYTKALTEAEVKWNRVVDEVRFRGVVTNGTVVVSSNRAGAEGTEASGMYYVNGNHTFTAPATVTIDGCTYELTGYKLEHYNASTKAWDFVEVSDAASFAYTNCEANTGARITWNWRLKNGVKRIDADDYVQGGLVFGFDGIRNAGLGVAHDSTATTWKNLGSGPDATFSMFAAANGPGAWKDKGYDFTAGSCFYADREVSFGRQATTEFAVEYNPSAQTAKWPSIFGTGNINSDRYNLYTYTPRAGAGDINRGDHLRFNTGAINGLSFGVQPWDNRFGHAVIDNARSSISNAPAYAWQTGSASADIGTYRYSIGSAQNSTDRRTDRAFTGMIYAVRMYDRMLTEAELAHNMEIDNMRYYAGASRSTDTNLVEVACEIPGVNFADLGCWILRGDGASKEFTAPATFTVGNNTYSCTGYRLETWNASKRMWETPVETAIDLMVELSSTNQNRRLTWLYTITSGIRSAADYDVHDYVQQGLVANYDGIRNNGAENEHALLGMFWKDSSYRDVSMLAASNTAFNAWIGIGHHFNAAEDSFFEMTEPISLGKNSTIQAVLDAPGRLQTKNFPLYIGFGNADNSIFTRWSGTKLEQKLDSWLGPRTYCDGWTGQYFTHIVTPTDTYLFEGVEYANKTARTVFSDLPNNKFSIGAPNTYTNGERTKRCLNGDYYALRIYNRVLTEEEIAHNRTIDEIRYRGNFTNANVTVVCEVPFEGVEAPVAMPAGDYEVTGSFTFTASGLTFNESTFPVRYTVETWDGSEWGAPVEYESSSYTYTAGAKVRLTWKWADPTIPVKATWTGLGDAGNLLDPENWSCVNAGGETITAAPTNVTTVVINGTTSFSIPDGVTTFPWKEIQFGGDVHTALRCGTWSFNSNSDYTGTPPGMFTVLSASETALSNLDNGSYSTTPSAWQRSHLYRQRVRFDGWVYVTPAQAGTWTVNQKFDDYYCFGIDGEWVVANPTYQAQLVGMCEVSAGWHRFTIICGDTGGNGWGAYPASAVQVEGVDAPMSISWGDAAVRFVPSNFTFGTDAAPVITLSCDCDWSALGEVAVMSGATIDLNGHNLDLASITSDYIGATITNSNDAVQSTVTFTAPEGQTVRNDLAICGNVNVVKKGAGTYCSYARCAYSGYTFVDEGTAQPPDGSDAASTYSYDSFKAFSTNEIVVASGATFDLRANYAYRSHIVLNGGTLTNTKENMTKTTWGGSGIGRLEADSTNRVPCSIVFGDSNGNGNMDLNGYTLTVLVGSARRFYLRCAKIENGKMDFAAGDGWFQVVNACMATNVDFRVNSALSVGAALSVRDYEAVWSSNTKTHNEGTAALNVYGTFTPAAGQKFYGCTMQNDSTINLSGQSGTFSTLSYYTGGSTNIKFAANANVTVNLAGREGLSALAREKGFVMTWPEGLGPAAGVKFQVDAETSRNGFKVVRDNENNGLRFVRKGGFTLFLR